MAHAVVHAVVHGDVAAGRQPYLVVPLVEASGIVDLRAATEMADHLAQELVQEEER